MDALKCTLSPQEFKIFHGIDRALYMVLVKDLWRNPSECLHIMGLWLWFEGQGFKNLISKILSLSPVLINELAEEALVCLKRINNESLISYGIQEMPLIQTLVKKNMPSKLYRQSRVTTLHEVQRLISDVCIPALRDLFEEARSSGFNERRRRMVNPKPPTVAKNSPPRQMKRSTASYEKQPIRGGCDFNTGLGSTSGIRPYSPRSDRTMFVTFSKGYPVTEDEVKDFFDKIFGITCIEAFHMQEVNNQQQALYARIVFLKPEFIESILNGVGTAKFTINGKHVWMRKFVPKNARFLHCGCMNAYSCHH